ncbi:MAG: KH domain-containing protein [Clostridia bacterium]|nr:KH domain-containing protein [Clostridia bacterium]
MSKVLCNIAKAIVDNPDQVSVTETAQENDEVLLVLSVAEDDMGMIIGKHGKIARAIRVVMKAIAKNDDRKVVVEIK